jgi:hypothetical protein
LHQLHEKGRVGIEDRIIRLLVNRLRMQRDVEKHPEILSEQLLPPAVIIGLPRTGSTKLQRMLAAGHGFHELLMWQAFNPAPFPGADRGTRDPRVQAAADFVAWVARDAPDSHKGHMMIVEGTEEENHLLEQTFDTPTTVSFVPAYSWCKYIERVDKTASYAICAHAFSISNGNSTETRPSRGCSNIPPTWETKATSAEHSRVRDTWSPIAIRSRSWPR